MTGLWLRELAGDEQLLRGGMMLNGEGAAKSAPVNHSAVVATNEHVSDF